MNWEDLSALAVELTINITDENINIRYIYGELRLEDVCFCAALLTEM
jgi:hypothetical protein